MKKKKKKIHGLIFPLIVHIYLSFSSFYFIHNNTYVILLMDKAKYRRFSLAHHENDEC